MRLLTMCRTHWLVFPAIIAALTATVVSAAPLKTFNLDKEHVPGQLIVKFKRGASAEKSALGVLAGYGAFSAIPFSRTGAMKVTFPGKESRNSLMAVAQQIASRPDVLYVEANTIIRMDAKFPNDPNFAQLYGMHNDGSTGGTANADINAPEAWEVSTGSKNVVVGVIDTGIDYTHPDIAPNYWTNPGETGTDSEGRDKQTNGVDDDNNGYVDDFRGWDFVNNDNDPMDDNSHGTHCAGTIGGKGNDGVGVVGVNWDVSLVGIKFLSGGGSGTLEDAVKAIEYGTKIGVQLTSNSWGGGGFSDTMAAAIAEAQSKNILFVAAAGNSSADNDSDPHYPSSYDHDNVIAVAATDNKDGMAYFSCFGSTSVDLGAPGVDILSSIPEGHGYTKYSGTSMATPHVAGAAALVKSAFPELNAAQVKARLLNGVDQVQSLQGKTTTGGRLNLENSLEVDSIAPGAVAGIRAVGATRDSVTFNFTATGDDGDSGLAKGYEVRISSTPITDAEGWAAARRAKASFSVNTDTREASVVISGLDFNSQGYLAIRATDNVGNMSSLSAPVPYAVRQVQVVARNTASSLADVVATGTWGVEDAPTSEDPDNKVFSDSPGADYPSNNDTSLTLPVWNVSKSDSSLVVRMRWNLENRYDNGSVEVSTDGTTWTALDTLTGDSGWVTRQYDLSGVLASSQTLQVRFKLTSDSSIDRDGWFIDDVMVVSSID
ncbi:MAG: hypothetical protein RIQ81_522 [Pseudomonadota bacterium]